ncbi:GNAT family N-acetyltransferase [Pseudonocardia oroxyli]|uniref:Acetyltransferase (GNAT) family protein n=1 Tax=Pseudonocardia oroxyli TaxID=366584 RepID=A0A1G7VUK3_PSEOR|nr:Acetyltransferase (GNAT) family protein [Pseudonocardia oroxyli]
MAGNIRVGATHVLCRDGIDEEVVGTITVSRAGDPQFWPSPGSSLYLAKLATDPRCAGNGYGSLLLDWSVDQAARLGLRDVRLDAWKTSPGLHRYYRMHGWRYIGTVHAPARDSGALFCRPARLLDLRHRLAEPVSPTGGMPSANDVHLVSDDAMEPRGGITPQVSA